MDNEELRLHHRGWLINPNTSRGQLADSKTILTLLDEQDALQARVAELEAQVLKYDEFWQKGDHPENARLQKLVDMNQKLVDACRKHTHRSPEIAEALRELDANQGEHREKKCDSCGMPDSDPKSVICNDGFHTPKD